MKTNPYQSPKTESKALPPCDDQWSSFVRVRRNTPIISLDRPKGITALCVLQGVLLPLMLLLSVWNLVVYSLDLMPIVAMAVSIFSIGLGSIAGMWNGARWGWWLGTLFYGICAMGNLFILIRVFLCAAIEIAPGVSAGSVLSGGILFIVFQGVFIYLYSDGVLAYFEWPVSSKFIMGGVVLLACCGIRIALEVAVTSLA